MPKKPKVKVKKIRAVRQPRAQAKKETHTHVINVYTDRQEPYRTDFKNQFRYGLGNVANEPFNPFSTKTSTTYIQPQSITEEIPSRSSFKPFAMPTGIPKKKIMIGEELELKSEFLNLASNNPYGSESEGGFSPRKPRADVGKPRGSYKEKAVIEGRNIQNVFALGSSSGGEGSPASPVYTTSRLGTSNY